MAVVYWLKAPHHSDYNTEGYVGVSVKTAWGRYVQHRSAAARGSHLLVHKAIRKYGSLEVVTLIEDNEEFCYLMEEMLRPHPGIGYNLAQGGEVSPTLGAVCTESTKRKIGNANRGAKNGMAGKCGELNPLYGKPILQATKDKISASYLLKNEWEKHNVVHGVWAMAQEMCDWLNTRPKLGFKGLSIDFGFSADSVIIIHNKLRSGWKPCEDVEWNVFKSEFDGDISSNLKVFASTLDKWKSTGGRPQSGKAQTSVARAKYSEWLKTQNFYPWNNPACIQSTWALSDDVYKYFVANPTHGEKRLADHMGFALGNLQTIQKKVKSGWIPLEDTAFVSWLSEYKQNKEAQDVT